MSEHRCTVVWRRREGEAFVDNKYGRSHRWHFDGGAEIGASSSPHVVPPPASDPALVDPEEAFVAALASCHMLLFLYVAARQGWVVDHYADEATGTMAADAAGRRWIAEVVLRPAVTFALGPSGTPSDADVLAAHEVAHESCFLANSVKTQIRIEPAFAPSRT